MNRQIAQSGRSMVEMLGVLAIIGILSIAAMAGYIYAMNKYRANLLMNEMMKRAVVIQTQVFSDRPMDLSEFNDEVVGATLSGDFGDPYISVSAEPVQEGVCDVAIKMRPETWAYQVNGVQNGLCQTGENSLLFRFHKDGAIIDSGEEEKPEETKDACEGISCNAPAVCIGGSCDCGTGKVYKNGACVCSDDSYIGDNCDVARKCPDGQFANSYGSCYSCAQEGTTSVGTNVEARTSCLACAAPNKRYITSTNVCAKVCGADEFSDANYVCRGCADMASYAVRTNAEARASCLACPASYMRYITSDNYCAKLCAGGEFMWSYGSCEKCSEPLALSIGTDVPSRNSCLACPSPDTRYVTGENYCARPCKTGEVQDARGSCYGCDHSSTLISVGTVGSARASCVACEAPYKRYVTDSNYCAFVCPADQFNASNGVCYPCDSADAQFIGTDSVSKAGCLACAAPNARYVTSGNYCARACKAGEEVPSSNGSCRSCDQTAAFAVGTDPILIQGCKDCGNRYLRGTGNLTQCTLCPAGQKPNADFSGCE